MAGIGLWEDLIKIWKAKTCLWKNLRWQLFTNRIHFFNKARSLVDEGVKRIFSMITSHTTWSDSTEWKCVDWGNMKIVILWREIFLCLYLQDASSYHYSKFHPMKYLWWWACDLTHCQRKCTMPAVCLCKKTFLICWSTFKNNYFELINLIAS